MRIEERPKKGRREKKIERGSLTEREGKEEKKEEEGE